MRQYIKIAGYAIVLIIILGIMAPVLVSSNSTFDVVIGIGMTLLLLPFTYYYFNLGTKK